MGKHKKTLQQKKLADARRKTMLEKTPEAYTQTSSHTHQLLSAGFSYTFTGAPSSHQKMQAYSLKHELYKTLGLSLAIIFFQLILFILLHNHTLVLPLVSFRY